MSDVKWIKIVVDIFDDEKIKLIEALPASDTIIVIWFKLLCLAGRSNNDGVLMMNNRIAYTDEMLSAIFRRKITDVQLALKTFAEYGMIEIIDDVYVIPNWSKHQSLDYYSKKKEHDREYRRKKREEQKLLIDGKQSKEKKSYDCRTTVERQSNDSSISISYSYSNNSNIDNLNYIIDNNLYKDIDYLLNNKELLNSIKEWMVYKDSKKPKSQHHYNGDIGISKLLSQSISHSKEYGIKAVVEIIDMSIANNWQGIAWRELERNSKKKGSDWEEAWLKK